MEDAGSIGDRETDKWICTECNYLGPMKSFDQVPDPRGSDTWTVCPQCRAPEHVAQVCDEPGCRKESSCGFPTPQGYRRTCGDHFRSPRSVNRLGTASAEQTETNAAEREQKSEENQ